jgi:hypothetical protein
MLLIYEEEAGGPERGESLSLFPALHRSLREAGVLRSVRALRRTDSATTVRVREGQTEIVDGPFAVTKEILGGYYVVDCADLDEAIAVAERLPPAGWGSIEVRPVMPAEEFVALAREAGAETTDEDVRNMG